MALANYSDLQTAVADWLARSDLTSKIPDFIALAESRINRELRVREMITRATGSISAQTLTVPADFVEVASFVLDTATDRPLEYRPFEDSQHRVAGQTSGQPLWFSTLGGSFHLFPAPGGTYDYTLDYYARVPALSTTATTNWLLTKAPDLYLFASLKEARSYLLEEDAAAVYDGRYRMALDSMHAAEARSKRTGQPRRARVLV